MLFNRKFIFTFALSFCRYVLFFIRNKMNKRETVVAVLLLPVLAAWAQTYPVCEAAIDTGGLSIVGEKEICYGVYNTYALEGDIPDSVEVVWQAVNGEFRGLNIGKSVNVAFVYNAQNADYKLIASFQNINKPNCKYQQNIECQVFSRFKEDVILKNRNGNSFDFTANSVSEISVENLGNTYETIEWALAYPDLGSIVKTDDDTTVKIYWNDVGTHDINSFLSATIGVCGLYGVIRQGFSLKHSTTGTTAVRQFADNVPNNLPLPAPPTAKFTLSNTIANTNNAIYLCPASAPEGIAPEGTNYKWTIHPVSGEISSVNNYMTAFYYLPAKSGEYRITLTETDKYGRTVTGETQRIHRLDNEISGAVNGNPMACEGEVVTLHFDRDRGHEISAYQWMHNNTEIAGATNPVFAVTQTGAYWVKLWTTDGCINEYTEPFQVTFVPLPIAKIQGQHSIGAAETVRLKGYIGLGDLSHLEYRWNIGNGEWREGNDKSMLEIEINTAGIYTLEVRNIKTDCSNSVSHHVEM
jgi:hypothetical protein